MKQLVVVLLAFAMYAPVLTADAVQDNTKAEDRVKSAGTVLDEIESAPDSGIPEAILKSADCVAVVPSLLKGGFIVAGSYGRGVASCRTPKGWSAPAFLFTSGGSFGFQIGGQATDLVLLIMNKDGMANLLSSKFKLGADASVAAGPVGRAAAADTDWKLRAQVLTYSRTRGAFAGLELNGAVVKMDRESTLEFYNHLQPFDTTLKTASSPPAAFPFLNNLAKWAKIASK